MLSLKPTYKNKQLRLSHAMSVTGQIWHCRKVQPVREGFVHNYIAFVAMQRRIQGRGLGV